MTYALIQAATEAAKAAIMAIRKVDNQVNNAKPVQTIKTVQKEKVKAATEPVRLAIKQSTGSSITINGKTHQPSITKEHLLKKYADIFGKIGTLPGGEYCI